MEDLIGIALRISVTYIYILALMRLSGKRTLGALSPIDLVVTFVVGDMFDDIFWAEVPLAMGLVGLTTIVVLHVAVEYVTCRSRRAERLIAGDRVVMVRSGKMVEAGMRKERLAEAELQSLLRMQGIDDPNEIREASHEPSGELSVFEKEEFKPADRRDLQRVRELVR